MSASGSVAAGPKRIRLLDVLRGFAILGTLGTNIWIFTAIGGGLGDGAADKEALAEAALRWWTSLDSVVMQVSSFLTNGKFLALLTIMFGVGLEILHQRSQRRNLPWLVPYLWRSALLFADGVVHFLLVVEFDILMGYAVAAMIVAFLIGRSDRTIKIAMWVSGGLHLLLQGALGVVFAVFFSDPQQAKDIVEDAVGRDFLAIEGYCWFIQWRCCILRE